MNSDESPLGSEASETEQDRASVYLNEGLLLLWLY